jgi:hypothetical protein
VKSQTTKRLSLSDSKQILLVLSFNHYLLSPAARLAIGVSAGSAPEVSFLRRVRLPLNLLIAHASPDASPVTVRGAVVDFAWMPQPLHRR